MSKEPGPIGIFDSGYGGLTILHGIRQLLPEYDYITCKRIINKSFGKIYPDKSSFEI